MKKKIMALLLAALLVAGILPITAMATTTSYDYYEWDVSQKKLVAANTKTETETKTVAVINASNKPTKLNGWYYVNETVTIDNLVELNGTVYIILGTDANITFNKGIEGSEKTLNIYGVNANGTGGKLTAKGVDGAEETLTGCGISVETLNVHGGNVIATGGKGKDAYNEDFGGNGISIAEDGKFNIYGGTVTATGGAGSNCNTESGESGDGGVGIGGTLNSYGGTVTAKGGNGGTGVTENDSGGNGGAGINGPLNSYGGKVTATGGDGGDGHGSKLLAGSSGGFGLYMLSMTGGKIVAIGGKSGINMVGAISYSGAIHTETICEPILGESKVNMDGTKAIPEGFVIKTDANVDGSTKAVWTPSGDPLNSGNNVYVEILFGEDEEDDTPDEVRHSYTTITIGGNKDKAETKAEEVKEEENPDTGAPVMNLGAVAVVLGAAYVLSKKH